MATNDSAEARRTRALISALREVGDMDTAKRLESELTAGGTPQRDTVQHGTARSLTSAY